MKLTVKTNTETLLEKKFESYDEYDLHNEMMQFEERSITNYEIIFNKNTGIESIYEFKMFKHLIITIEEQN